jgi:hypothetical protein
MQDNPSDPFLDAMQIVRAEVKRAVQLFPSDETEAICELLRRSHQLPDVKRAMLVICAFKLIDAERQEAT